MAKAKRTFCRCSEADGRWDLVPEPVCRFCGFVIKRRLPGRPIQDTAPVAAWAGPGPCPRPPEMLSPAAARGIELALRGAALARSEGPDQSPASATPVRPGEPASLPPRQSPIAAVRAALASPHRPSSNPQGAPR